MSGYLPDGCTQEDCDRAAGGYDEGYYCNWCEERVDEEHECPAYDACSTCGDPHTFDEACTLRERCPDEATITRQGEHGIEISRRGE